jgi:hypothetical protein
MNESKAAMTARRRQLIFKVADGYDPTLPVLHFLDSMVRCDDILRWLIAHRFTGKNMCQFLHQTFGNKMLDMSKFILQQIDKTNDPQAIILGRDVIPL